MAKNAKNEAKKNEDGGKIEAGAASDPARQLLLARVAGDVASGIMCSPSESASTAEAIAAIAVDVAEEILKKAGL